MNIKGGEGEMRTNVGRTEQWIFSHHKKKEYVFYCQYPKKKNFSRVFLFCFFFARISKLRDFFFLLFLKKEISVGGKGAGGKMAYRTQKRKYENAHEKKPNLGRGKTIKKKKLATLSRYSLSPPLDSTPFS